MNTLLKSALCLVAGLLLAVNANAADKIDPNGKWTWTSEGRNGGTRTNVVTLKLDGEKLSGTVLGGGRQGQAPTEIPIEEAKLTADEVSFQVTREFNGNKFVAKYSGKIAGDTMKGKVTTERDGQPNVREFEAKRETAKK